MSHAEKKKREDKCSGELFRTRLSPRISRGHFSSRFKTDEAKEGLLVVYAQSRCQFADILMAPDYVNLQRFYGAPTMSIYRDFVVPRLCQFTEILSCPDYVNLRRFYGAPTMSIYRDFMVPRLCQFTEILWGPDYVNLQRFYGALTMSIYREFT